MNKVAVIGIVGNSVFLPVQKFHVGGETVEAESVRFEFGGKGFNQAVAAARMGAEISFLATIGTEYGEDVDKFLRREKIKATLVAKNSPTAFAAIVTDKTGANRVTVYQGPQLTSKDVEAFAEEIKKADYLLLTNETAEEVNLRAAEIAFENGVKIILNPAPQRKSDERLLDKVFLFTPNEHEAEGLENYLNVLQTLGKKGCVYRSTGEIFPPTDDAAVDTTGAGDTFNGALAASLAAGKALRESVLTAVKASGKSVTKKGAVSSIPYEYEIR